MLKCESKLIRFLFELNGLVQTDRHDWNVLWTHTQGKNYFYERLNAHQKVNHFPVTIELTRKDRMAINIKRMQEKHLMEYFNFIPQSFVLPDQFDSFVEAFKKQEVVLKNQYLMSNGQSSTDGNRPLRYNYWIVKPASSSRGRGIYIVSDPK
jgi:tubulin polyglutamylase TTLL5